MMFGLPIFFAGALTLGALQSPADAPSTTAPTSAPATAPSSDIAALLEKLTGDDAAGRDAAQLALLDIGEDALTALDAARRDVRDPDVQVRLDTLLVQIRERADIGASKITLKFQDAPLDEVLASLAKQARTDFGADLVNQLAGGNPAGLPRLTLDLQDVSFWRAVQEIQDSANVMFYPQADGWRVQRNFGQQFSLRGSEAGAFLVQPLNAIYQRTIAYSRNMGGADGEQFTISFQALGEPKIKLASGTGMMTLERAVDANGNDLLGAQRGQQINTGSGQNSIMCSMQLKYPKNPGTTIAEIRGMLRISIARHMQTVASDDVMGGKTNATIEGAKIRIEPSAEDVPGGGVAFTVTIESGDMSLGQRMQQNPQMIRVSDSRDARLQLSAFNVIRNDPRGVVIRVGFTKTQPQSKGPFKLRIDVPTSFREVDVPFVMKDLRMP